LHRISAGLAIRLSRLVPQYIVARVSQSTFGDRSGANSMFLHSTQQTDGF
jgi:hypothetical protein